MRRRKAGKPFSFPLIASRSHFSYATTYLRIELCQNGFRAASGIFGSLSQRRISRECRLKRARCPKPSEGRYRKARCITPPYITFFLKRRPRWCCQLLILSIGTVEYESPRLCDRRQHWHAVTACSVISVTGWHDAILNAWTAISWTIRQLKLAYCISTKIINILLYQVNTVKLGITSSSTGASNK